MSSKCIRLIETWGLASALQAADTALKEEVYSLLVDNKSTTGTEKQIKSGKRPQGTGKKGKWIGRWNPKGSYIYE